MKTSLKRLWGQGRMRLWRMVETLLCVGDTFPREGFPQRLKPQNLLRGKLQEIRTCPYGTASFMAYGYFAAFFGVQETLLYPLDWIFIKGIHFWAGPIGGILRRSIFLHQRKIVLVLLTYRILHDMETSPSSTSDLCKYSAIHALRCDSAAPYFQSITTDDL